MSQLLPHTPVAHPETKPERVLRFDGDAAAVIEALRCETARQVLNALHRHPNSPSGIARTIDASIQTVTYHLENLQAAGLVTVVDRWYSPKGREMDVYAPVADRLIIDIENDGDREDSGNGESDGVGDATIA